MRHEVIHGDCLEELYKLERHSVDMILTDPPYGTTQNAWDSVVPFDQMWDSLSHVIKPNGAIVMTSAQPFTSALVMSNPKSFKYDWIWQKENATGHINAHRMPMREHEHILVFHSTRYYPQGLLEFGKMARSGPNSDNYGKFERDHFQAFTNYPWSVLKFNRDFNKLHPTQKPVALFEYLIKTYTNPGELVLDPFAGSGTTGVAARLTDRNFVLIEKEQQYVDIIKERLSKDLIKQTILFGT